MSKLSKNTSTPARPNKRKYKAKHSLKSIEVSFSVSFQLTDWGTLVEDWLSLVQCSVDTTQQAGLEQALFLGARTTKANKVKYKVVDEFLRIQNFPCSSQPLPGFKPGKTFNTTRKQPENFISACSTK